MEPATSIIEKLGGEAAIAKAIGRHASTPYRWRYSKDKKGTGGLIPQKYIPKLLELARSQNKELSLADFFPASPQEQPAP